MRVQCDNCNRIFDVGEARVVSEAAAILAKRRRKITSEQAKSMQTLAVRARLANAAKKMLDKKSENCT